MIVVLAEIYKEEDLKLIRIKSVEIMEFVTPNDNARVLSFEDELTGVDMSAIDTNGDGEIVIADEREYVAWEY